MKLSTLLTFSVALFLVVLPVSAKTGQTAFDEYLRAQGIPIDGISGSGADCRIDFKPEATQKQRDWASAERATFDWVDTPGPDYRGFRFACYKLSQVNAAHIPYINVLSDPELSDADRKALWAKAKGLLGNLDPASSRIESTAATYGVALK
jgi:hypothetical protein